VGVAVGWLLLAAVGLLIAAFAAASGEGLAEELSGLARALRANPDSAHYQRLASFAEQHRESELSAQAEFALGMADFEKGWWSQARERFRRARPSRWLNDYATLFLSRTEAELGAHEAAGRTLDGFSLAGSLLEQDAQVLRAHLMVRAGKAGEAVDWLLGSPGVEKRPHLLLALAKAQRTVGQAVAAAETLHGLYYQHPLSPEAAPANELSAELRVELKAQYPAPSEALRRTRAEKLWAAGAYRGARSAYLDLSVRASEPTRTQARFRAAVALYNLRAVKAACRELGRISRVPPAEEAAFRSYRARCALVAGAQARAEADIDFLEKNFATTEWHRKALLAAGNTALANEENGRARDYYRRLTERFSQGRDAEEAHWKLAWLTYRARERAAAARLLEEHFTRFPESPFLGRALFWRARLALDARQEPVAQRLLCLQGAPAGDGSPLPPWLEKLSLPPARPPAGALPPLMRRQLEKAAVLARLGFWEMADRELEATLETMAHPEISLAQARSALEREKYALATETLRRAHRAYWRYRLDDLPREVWEIMFPRPYWKLIEREARRQRLDPYLVAALIRQESRFEAQAVSSAGALGLMQLMPRTARSLARQRSLSRSRILDPQLNVRLGTRFLAQLLRRFDGNLEKAVAGYNAGGTRVAQWVTEADASETPEFVESIPVTQTREFVYIVLRNYRFYRDLYAQP
jgi:soluble lytic murein transglycosylase